MFGAGGRGGRVSLDAALKVFDRERQTLDFSGFQRLVSPKLVRHVPQRAAGSGGGGSGFVSYSRHATEEIEAAIDDVIRGFAELRCGFEWKVFEHDLPGDLLTRLAKRGFDIGEKEELLFLPLAEARSLLGSRSAHRVERVTTPAGISDYVTLAAATWEHEREYIELVKQEMRTRPDEIGLYVAYVDDEPMASARASFPRGARFAGLWAGATLPAHRRQGLYRALVEARARDAAERGFDYLMVDAQPTSEPILVRMGFRRLSASRPCRWPPAATQGAA